jgi:uncharacterized protein
VFHVLRLTYLQPLDVIDKTRQRHVAWVQQEIEDGRLLLAGRQEDQSGGVLITTDIGADEAENVIESDPYQQAGLVRYERIGFNGAFPGPRFVGACGITSHGQRSCHDASPAVGAITVKLPKHFDERLRGH